MGDKKNSGPLTSLEGADGKVPDAKYDKNNFLPGPGGILLIIVAILAVVCGLGEALNWHW
ncbi:MAG: hypothetical protein WCU00_04195 [Candidatus Latescibacterota bacterium]|jgi:hypothetical protein